MIRTIFVTLFLCFLASAQLRAQCTTTGDPAISIGNLCVQSPGTYTIPIDIENWGGLHAWSLKFCMNAPKGFTLTNVTSLVNGQSVTMGPGSFNADFTLAYGTSNNCNNIPRVRGAIAELTFTVSPNAAAGSCVDVDLCTSSFSGSRAYECSGDFILQYNVIGCSGGICMGSGSSVTSIRGTIKTVNGTPLPGITVANSINSTTVTTNVQGKYVFNNLQIGCAAEVDITPQFTGPSNNGIDQADLDMLVDFLSNNITLTCEEMLAADVNYSEIVTTNDAIGLNHFINSPSQNSFNTGYWRFYSTGTVLSCNPTTNSITAPPYSSTVQLSGAPVSGVDFTAIKSGDLTGNASSKTNTSSSSQPVPEQPTVGPNPFSDFVTLRFQLETTSEVTLRVIDLSGKILERRQVSLEAGSQALEVDGREWPQGVLMYELTTGAERFSGRFLHIN